MDYTAIFSQIAGAAGNGAFGSRASNLARRFAGNPAPVSASSPVIMTVPQTVNPAANPGASITDTSAPSSALFMTKNGSVSMLTIIILASVGVYLLAKGK